MVKTTKAPAGQQEPRARAPGGQWSPAPTRALRAAAPHAPDSPAHRSPHRRPPAPPPGPHRPGPAAGAFRKHPPVGIALRAPALRLLSALRPQPQATRQPRSASDPGRAAAFPRPGWGDRGDMATNARTSQRAGGPGATALGSYRGCRTWTRALTLGRRPHRLRVGLRGGRASRDACPEGSALRLATGRGASATAGDTRSLPVLPQARARPRPGPGRHRRSWGRGQQPRSHVPPQRPPASPFSRLRPAAVLGQALVTTLCPLVPHWL